MSSKHGGFKKVVPGAATTGKSTDTGSKASATGTGSASKASTHGTNSK